MSSKHNPHPSPEQLAAFDSGRLAPSERETIARHLAGCPVCGRRVDEQAAHQIAARLRPHHFLWLTIAVLVAVGLVLLLPRPRKPKPPPLAETIPETVHKPPAADSPPSDPLAVAKLEQRVQRRFERRKQALGWLANNSSKGRQRALVRDTNIQFDNYRGRIDAFQIQLGSLWLDGWPAAVLEANVGGFAVYRLSEEQARALNIDRATRVFRCSLAVRDKRRATPRIHLSALRFDDAQRLNPREKASGSIDYEVRGPAIVGDFAIRLSVMLESGTRHGEMQWFENRKLEGRGTLRLSSAPFWPPAFQALRSKLNAYATLLLQSQPLSAIGCSSYLLTAPFQLPTPVVVFAELCTRDESPEASKKTANACATLLLQNQPLAAVGCSSYFLTAPSLIVESDAVAALVEAVPLAKKPVP